MGGQADCPAPDGQQPELGLEAVTNAPTSLASLIWPETALIPRPFTIATTQGMENCFANGA